MSGSYVHLADAPSWIPVVAAVTGATMAAILTVLTALLQDWRLRRNAAARQRQAIVDTDQYMSLIQHTLDASRGMPGSQGDAETERWAAVAFNRSFAEMPEPVRVVPGAPKSQRVVRILRRGLLIAKPTSTGMAVAQLAFYFLLSFAVIFIVVSLSDSTETLGIRVLVAVFFLLVLGLPAVFAHHWAVKKSKGSLK